MILAEKILKLRKESGMSQEELAEKLNVSRQSVSKWESAAVYPELDKILQLAGVFGVTTDYLLKDDMEQLTYTGKEESRCPRVSLQAANEFLDVKVAHAKRTALAAVLFVLCPVPVVFLDGASQAHMIPLAEDVAGGIGAVLLLLFVALGCVVSISASSWMRRFAYLRSGNFELEYGVEGVIREKWNASEHRRVAFLSLSIALIILSVTPLVIAGSLGAQDTVLIFLTGLMFMLIAASVGMIIATAAVPAGCATLLSEEVSGRTDSRTNRNKVKKFRGIYWPIVVAAYLLWSFLTRDWGISWVVWPVAALVGAGISSIWKTPRDD